MPKLPTSRPTDRVRALHAFLLAMNSGIVAASWRSGSRVRSRSPWRSIAVVPERSRWTARRRRASTIICAFARLASPARAGG